MRSTTRRVLQTESNFCDILGSFYEEKAGTACCCLGRGKLMGTPLRKWGQLTKAELQFSTSRALVDVDPPYFSQGFKSNLFQGGGSSIYFSCSPCVSRQVSAPAFCHFLSLKDRWLPEQPNPPCCHIRLALFVFNSSSPQINSRTI